jgi:excisionase family DNA binding protein
MYQEVKECLVDNTLEKRAYSVEQAAYYIGGSRPTVYRLMDSGDLPSIHIGRRRMILKEDLDKFLDRQLAREGNRGQ